MVVSMPAFSSSAATSLSAAQVQPFSCGLPLIKRTFIQQNLLCAGRRGVRPAFLYAVRYHYSTPRKCRAQRAEKPDTLQRGQQPRTAAPAIPGFYTGTACYSIVIFSTT